MLRQRVWQEWQSCKDKVVSLKKDLIILGEAGSSLPTFPIGLPSCRNNLDHWTSYDYQVKLEQAQHKISQLTASEPLLDLIINCSSSLDMFKELTTGWKQERDNDTGPTIQEID